MPIENLNDCVPEQSITNSDIFPLGSYLAGLVEGDGTIVVPKTERSAKGKLNYPSIQITFQLKDFPLCQAIQRAYILFTLHSTYPYTVVLYT